MSSCSIRRIGTHPSDSNDIPYRQVREYLVHECIVGETNEMMVCSEECGHHCMNRAVLQHLPYESMLQDLMDSYGSLFYCAWVF